MKPQKTINCLVVGDMINLENTPRTEPRVPALPPTPTKKNIVKPRNSQVIDSFDSLSFQKRDSDSPNPKTAANSETKPEHVEQSADPEIFQKDKKDTNKTAMMLPSKIPDGKAFLFPLIELLKIMFNYLKK